MAGLDPPLEHVPQRQPDQRGDVPQGGRPDRRRPAQAQPDGVTLSGGAARPGGRLRWQPPGNVGDWRVMAPGVLGGACPSSCWGSSPCCAAGWPSAAGVEEVPGPAGLPGGLGRTQLREQLCALLWDGPAIPGRLALGAVESGRCWTTGRPAAVADASTSARAPGRRLDLTPLRALPGWAWPAVPRHRLTGGGPARSGALPGGAGPAELSPLSRLVPGRAGPCARWRWPCAAPCWPGTGRRRSRPCRMRGPRRRWIPGRVLDIAVVRPLGELGRTHEALEVDEIVGCRLERELARARRRDGPRAHALGPGEPSRCRQHPAPGDTADPVICRGELPLPLRGREAEHRRRAEPRRRAAGRAGRPDCCCGWERLAWGCRACGPS